MDEGFFAAGKFHEPGMLVDERDGTIFTGLFAAGKKHGPAVIVHPLPTAGGIVCPRARYENGASVELRKLQRAKPRLHGLLTRAMWLRVR